MKLERTEAFEEALEQLHHGGAFTMITGRAGTGKSTLLQQFLLETPEFVPVLAPTGIAALNVGGQTIHRFFGFSPNVTPEKAKVEAKTRSSVGIFRKINLIIIDEISMVRADLMDCMDVFLRIARNDKRPFGGVRMVVVGDMYQLPPVVTTRDREAFGAVYPTPYFFSSQVMGQVFDAEAFCLIELTKIYRQKDERFIHLLNGIRHHSATKTDMQELNAVVGATLPKDAITLTTRNVDADTINTTRLKKLKGEEKSFDGLLNGDFERHETPTDSVLLLKKQARVMCIANDPLGRFVNGSLGWVEGFDTDEQGTSFVLVRLDDGQTVAVGPHTWSLYQSVLNDETKTIEQEAVGSFTQLPLRLAWAVTIHKSQGKTFDHVVVDFGQGAFASGQAYVALSRCRSLEGLSLTKPVTNRDVRLDEAVVQFMDYHRSVSVSE
ncbi:MAG: AAA family ATPase [Candidatus Magasanikbacteria bacterium]|nr:AAA family ATPase [Candidatus Magasanikbacteria bacterium]